MTQTIKSDELRELQNRYVAACERFGFPDTTTVDCKFPGVTVGHLRTELHPELAADIQTNLMLFPVLPTPEPATTRDSAPTAAELAVTDERNYQHGGDTND